MGANLLSISVLQQDSYNNKKKNTQTQTLMNGPTLEQDHNYETTNEKQIN